MNRQFPTRFSEQASFSTLNQTLNLPIHSVTSRSAIARAEISSSGCFPAAASTRFDKRSIPTASHGRVSFHHYPFGHIASPRGVELASACASGLLGVALSLSRTVDRLARRPAHLQIDHEQHYPKNDVLTRSVDALPARADIRLNQARYRARVFCELCITSLQTSSRIFHVQSVSLIFKTKVLSWFVLPLNYLVFLFYEYILRNSYHLCLLQNFA